MNFTHSKSGIDGQVAGRPYWIPITSLTTGCHESSPLSIFAYVSDTKMLGVSPWWLSVENSIGFGDDFVQPFAHEPVGA